jgi:hypothetical protein
MIQNEKSLFRSRTSIVYTEDNKPEIDSEYSKVFDVDIFQLQVKKRTKLIIRAIEIEEEQEVFEIEVSG